MAKPKDLSNMTVDELAVYSTSLKHQIAAINDERMRIQEAMTARVAHDRAMDIAGNLSEEEKGALHQVLSVDGIETKGSVGTPGE